MLAMLQLWLTHCRKLHRRHPWQDIPATPSTAATLNAQAGPGWLITHCIKPTTVHSCALLQENISLLITVTTMRWEMHHEVREAQVPRSLGSQGWKTMTLRFSGRKSSHAGQCMVMRNVSKFCWSALHQLLKSPKFQSHVEIPPEYHKFKEVFSSQSQWNNTALPLWLCNCSWQQSHLLVNTFTPCPPTKPKPRINTSCRAQSPLELGFTHFYL